MKRLIPAALLLSSALAAPALAQDQNLVDPSGERVNQLIVYGDDECPVSEGDTITVCARKAESERFRIPEPLRQSSSPQNEAWNNKVIAYDLGISPRTLRYKLAQMRDAGLDVEASLYASGV